MRTRNLVLLLVSVLPLLLAGCDLGASGGTPATVENVPHAGSNPYTRIYDSIFGIYNGLQSSNPTYGNISGTPSEGSQGE